jgi:RNA polymerase primary sigma factor
MVAKTDSTAQRKAPDRQAVEALGPEEAALYREVPSDVRYVHHESFDSPRTASRLFADDEPQRRPPPWTHCPEPEDSVAAAHAKAFRLDRHEEAKLFLQFNYARFRLARLRAARPTCTTVAQIRGTLLWYRRAMDARTALVRANLPLVLTMAKRFGTQNVEFSELVCEGNFVLLRCIESFDVSRGFKFSTYACRALLKSFSRLAAKTGRYRRYFPAGLDPDLERSNDAEQKQEARRDSSIEALREVLADNRAGLGDVERTVVLERFGIASCGKRKTLAAIAQTLGLCAESVRQIQQRALKKLRLALEDECIPV